ncbi:hypothetical protein BH10PSE14_BH10PSE14_38660 [soil metagenome]
MEVDLGGLVELVEEKLGWGWATLAAAMAILIPIGILTLVVGAGIIDAGIFG